MILVIKVIPNAHKNAVDGFMGETLKVRVKSPPDKGKANDELLDFLSTVFSIPKSRLSIISGHSSRLKKIKIEGLSTSEFEKMYSRLNAD